MYCPGLDCIARGFLLVDGACGMLESELLRQLHLSPRNERPLGPLVATFAAPGDGFRRWLLRPVIGYKRGPTLGAFRRPCCQP